MMLQLFAHSAQALGMAARDSLPHPVHLCIGSLVASGPAKVVGCNVVTDGQVKRAHRLWGTCG